MILHCSCQGLSLVLPDLHIADFCHLLILAESNQQPAVRQLVSLQYDAQTVAALLQLLACSRTTEGEIVVGVRLLRIVVRTDLVEPEHNLVTLLVLTTAEEGRERE
jgi:hypothetical protein